jgi:hypothetical protein
VELPVPDELVVSLDGLVVPVELEEGELPVSDEVDSSDVAVELVGLEEGEVLVSDELGPADDVVDGRDEVDSTDVEVALFTPLDDVAVDSLEVEAVLCEEDEVRVVSCVTALDADVPADVSRLELLRAPPSPPPSTPPDPAATVLPPHAATETNTATTAPRRAHKSHIRMSVRPERARRHRATRS